MHIEPGCLALVINSGRNNGEVTVGKFIGIPPAPIKNVCWQESDYWEVDKLIRWHDANGEYGYVSCVPESSLLRIDGYVETEQETVEVEA